MKLKFCKKFDLTDSVLSYKDQWLVIDFLGIHFIGKKSGKEEASIIDFYEGSEATLFSDHYLLLKNEEHGYKTYDLDAKTPLKEIDACEKGMAVDHGDLVHDGKLYLLSGRNGDDFRGNFHFVSKDAPNNSLLVYSLDDMSLLEEIHFDACMDRIVYCGFRDSFLLISRDRHIYEMKDGKIAPAENASFAAENLLVNEEKREAYFITDFGMRLYNDQLREINKFDLVSDDYDESVGLLFQRGPDIMDVPRQWLQKELIHGIELVSPEWMVMMSSKKTGSSYSLTLISTKDGSFASVMSFNYPIQAIYAQDGVLYVCTHRCILMMEVVEQ